jgi:Transposase DDE domain
VVTDDKSVIDFGATRRAIMAPTRRSTIGLFAGAAWAYFAELAGKGGKREQITVDATHLKAHRTAASLLKKGLFPDVSGRTKGGLNSKLHAVCDSRGRPLVMLLSEVQMSDYKGAALMLPAMPKAKQLLADKGYDADWFRAALAKRRDPSQIPIPRDRPWAVLAPLNRKLISTSRRCLRA